MEAYPGEAFHLCAQQAWAALIAVRRAEERIRNQKSACLQRLLTHCWRVSGTDASSPTVIPLARMHITVYGPSRWQPHDSDPLRGLRSRIQLFSNAVQSGRILVRISNRRMIIKWNRPH